MTDAEREEWKADAEYTQSYSERSRRVLALIEENERLYKVCGKMEQLRLSVSDANSSVAEKIAQLADARRERDEAAETLRIEVRHTADLTSKLAIAEKELIDWRAHHNDCGETILNQQALLAKRPHLFIGQESGIAIECGQDDSKHDPKMCAEHGGRCAK